MIRVEEIASKVGIPYVAHGPDGHTHLLARETREMAEKDGLEYFLRTRELVDGKWVLFGGPKAETLFGCLRELQARGFAADLIRNGDPHIRITWRGCPDELAGVEYVVESWSAEVLRGRGREVFDGYLEVRWCAECAGYTSTPKNTESHINQPRPTPQEQWR